MEKQYKAKSNQVIAVDTRNDNMTPNACVIRGKLRSMGFQVSGQAANAGETEILVGYIPAGRGRVLLHLSAVSATVALGASTLRFESYVSSTMPFSGPETLPSKDVSKAVTVAANALARFEEVEMAGFGIMYNSLEDIPLVLKVTTALTAAAEITGQIVYVQE